MSKPHSSLFWLASGLALLVACALFHKTVLVDHPEFVSFAKVLVAFGVWMALMVAAFWLSKEKPARFWVVFVFTVILVCPVVLQLAKWLLRQLPFSR